MIVDCPSCRARFRVPDEHAGRTDVRFRCTSCEHVFTPNVAPPTAQPAAALASAPQAAPQGLPGGLPGGFAPGPDSGNEPAALPQGFAAPGIDSGNQAAVGLPGGFRTNNPGDSNLPGGFGVSGIESSPPGSIATASALPSGLSMSGVTAPTAPAAQATAPAAQAPAPAQLTQAPSPWDDAPASDPSPWGESWGSAQTGSQAVAPPVAPVVPAPSHATQPISPVGNPPRRPATQSASMPAPFPASASTSTSSAAIQLTPSAGQTAGARRPPAPATASGSVVAPLPAAPVPGAPDPGAQDPGGPAEAADDARGRFRVAQLDDRPEDIDIDESVRARIDPMVEFHDVFQDIRRAEKGDDKLPSERYFDTGLFSNPIEAERAARIGDSVQVDVPASEGLNLKAGSFAAGVASGEIGGSKRMMDSAALVAAALADSGLSEPSAARKSTDSPAVADLDLSGEAHHGASYLGAARFLGASLVALLCVVGALGYIAQKNGWMLDFAEFDQMIGVAFRGETYVAPGEAAVTDAPQWVAVLGDVADGSGDAVLEIGALSGGVYDATHGGRLALIDGTLRNDDAATYRNVWVVVDLSDASGEVVASRRVPAGVRLDQPALERAVDPAALDAEYVALQERVETLDIDSGDETLFSAAFPMPEEGFDGLTYAARLESAQREVPATWQPVSFPAADGE